MNKTRKQNIKALRKKVIASVLALSLVFSYPGLSSLAFAGASQDKAANPVEKTATADATTPVDVVTETAKDVTVEVADQAPATDSADTNLSKDQAASADVTPANRAVTADSATASSASADKGAKLTTQEAAASSEIPADACRVRFFVDDASSPDFPDILVKRGDTLEKQPLPTPGDDTTIYKGWYVRNAQGNIDTSKEFDFSKPITDDLDLYVVSEHRYVATFYVLKADGSGYVVYETSEVDAAHHRFAAPSTDPSAPRGQSFEGWYEADSNEPFDFDQDVYTGIKGNVSLYAKFSGTCTIVFVTNGTPKDLLPVASGTLASTLNPDTPTRFTRDGKNKAFTFKGWKTEDGASFYFNDPSNDVKINNDLVLYADWDAPNVKVKLVYWFEKPNLASTNPDIDFMALKNYDFACVQENLEAPADSKVSAKDLKDKFAPPSNLYMSKYGEFFFGDEDVFVQDDGTTIINVYYKRIEYHIVFDLKNRENSIWGTMTINGSTYYPSATSNDDRYILAAKFEQDIDMLWPSNQRAKLENISNSGVDFLGWYCASNGYTYMNHRMELPEDFIKYFTIEKQGKDFRMRAVYSKTKPVEYRACLEVADVPNIADLEFVEDVKNVSGKVGTRFPFKVYRDKSNPEVEYALMNGTWFSWKNKFSNTHLVLYQDTTYHPMEIPAFTLVNGKEYQNMNYYPLKYTFYYRDKYNITFDSKGGSEVDGVSQIGFDADLNNYRHLFGTVPTKQGYTFKGWKKNDSDNDYFGHFDESGKYVFDQEATLSQGGLNLVADWEPNAYKVYYHLTEDGEEACESTSVQYNGRLSSLPDLTKLDNYDEISGKYGEFTGVWYWKTDGGQYIQYPLQNPVISDIHLFAKWDPKTYGVTYEDGGNPVKVPNDYSAYTYGTTARIKPVFSSDTDDANKLADGREFICWIEKATAGIAENYYHVNDVVEMTRDLVLEAFYLDASNKITVTYHANFGSDQTAEADYPTREYKNLGFKLPSAEQKGFVRDGYRFTGWKLENAGDLMTTGSTFETAESCHLYAQWGIRDDLSYTAYYVDKDTGQALDRRDGSNQTFGAKVPLSQLYQEIMDYDFDSVEVNGQPATWQSDSLPITTGKNEATFYYTKRADKSYIVNYYMDSNDHTLSVAPGNNFLGCVVVGGQAKGATISFNDASTYSDGSLVLSKYLPEGFVAPGTPDKATLVIQDSANVVNVVYTRQVIPYVVNYYKGSVSAANLLGSDDGTGAFDSEIPYEDGKYIADGYATPGALEGQRTVTVDAARNVLNVIYPARSDLPYVVNYLEEGTDAVLADPKTVDGQTYLSDVTEDAIDIDGYDKVAPTSATITIKTGTNVINFYYKKRTDLSYVVNYLEQSTNAVLHEPKVVDGQTFGASVTEEAIDIAGYDKVDPTSATITIKTGANVIDFYYAKGQFPYTVEYYYDGVIDGDATETGIAAFEDVIETYVDKTRAGYAFERTSGLPLTISTDGDANVIRVYYVTRTDLAYTVRYLEQGTDKVLAAPKNVTGLAYGSSVTEEAIEIAGYDKVAPISESFTIEAEGRIVTFYYTATPAPPAPEPEDPAEPEPAPDPEPEPEPKPVPDPLPTPEPEPAPAPVPDTPATTTGAPADDATDDATPAPAADATPVADDATPLAAAPADEAILDDATPMAAKPWCWVHWYIIIGIIMTFAYGLVAIWRRQRRTSKVDKYDDQVMGDGGDGREPMRRNVPVEA